MAAVDRELAAWARKHARALAQAPAATRARLIAQRRTQLVNAAAATPEERAEAGRVARASAASLRRFLLSGLEGGR